MFLNIVKTVKSHDAIVPTAPSPFVTPKIFPYEQAAKNLTMTASATKSHTLWDFAVEADLNTMDASTQTLIFAGVDVVTLKELRNPEVVLRLSSESNVSSWWRICDRNP